MYFGSVRFFKHLIVIMVVLLFIGLSISTIYFVVLNNHLSDRVLELESETEVVLAQAEVGVQNNTPSFEYQELYPELYTEPPAEPRIMYDTVYLTFDDGPSARTSEILDILKENNIKATFFITGKDAEKQKVIMRRIVNEDHSIGIHTYTHVYDYIYSSVDTFLSDFNKTFNLIYEETGIKPEIFRFPGGSINQYNSLIYQEIAAEMIRRGFTYYDWNASSGDAGNKVTVNSVYEDSVRTSTDKSRVVLLMHDSAGKSNTVKALPDVIKHFNEEGFEFDRITKDVSPITFNYIN